MPVGGEDDYVVLETVGTAARLRRRGLRAAGPPRARRGARRHRHGARRQGRRLAVLLPHRRRRPARARAAQHGDRPGHRGRLHPDDHPDAGQARGRWPAPASSTRTPTRSTASRPTTSTSPAPPRSPLAGYHADEILDLSDGPKRYAGLVGLLPPRGRVATARTPAASSGCTSSTRSRCSPTAGPRTRPPSTSGCWTGRRRCWPRSRCPTGSSTPRPATSAVRRRASSTARRGCRRRAATAS